MDDMALLREYATRNSEAAFETLVSRRVNFVYSAALRQVRDPHLAEEITQAVFIILARKAGRISNKTILTGWLFRTTRFAALAQIRTAAKRRQRELEANMQIGVHPAVLDEFWQQMSPFLDEALAQLGEKDRQVVLLRFFENKSLAEVGSSFGLGEDTARKRVARALGKLHQYFSKRGLSSTTSIIAGSIAANSIQVAPALLAKSITAAAIVKGAAASGSTLTLIKGALKIMAWTKMKTAMVAGAVVLLAAGTATVVVTRSASRKAVIRTETNEQYLRPEFQKIYSKKQFEGLKANQWPKERKLEQDRIVSRQQNNETTGAVTIDLKPYINVSLTESAASPIGNNEDNLAELPPGAHIYAGVPFDVQGSIQLMGAGMTRYNKTFPMKVDDILINRRCAKLHLLHGSNWTYLNAYGTTVAKLVLHYDDGSERDINMIAGEQVFDWWFPLFKTGLNPREYKTAPGTERAWTGRNPLLEKVWPGESLLLYKSTFTNPQPDVMISSIDYVSTMTMTAPFLVALTVE